MRIAVVGAGVVGAATTAALLERGVDVTCFERTGEVMTERSLGSSRIFRYAHRDAELVDLARRARAGYAVWEERAGAPMIGPEGCVVSTGDLPAWAAAMDEAGAAYELTEGDPAALGLPARTSPAASLVDPAGGVIDVDAVRTYLTATVRTALAPATVHAVESDGTVWTAGERHAFDAVLIAAGLGALPLAHHVGLYVPSGLSHHARFTYALPPGVNPPCWIDHRPGVLGTYQHRTGPGRWAVGGSVDPALVAWEVGPDTATAASRDQVTAYVRDHLTVDPHVVGTVYCTTVPHLGDGVDVQRSGAVVVVTGENLFKHAPALAATLAGTLAAG